MDKFRKTRNANKTDQGSLIEGFVRRTPTPGGTPFENKKIDSKKIPTRSIGIDDFKRPEGFASRSRSNNTQIPDGTSTGRKRTGEKIDMSLPGGSKKRGKKVKTKRLRKGMTTALSVCLLAAGFVVGFAYLRASQVFDGGASALALECNPDPASLTGEGDGRVNVLLLGRGGLGHTAPDLTDTIIIASIDTCQKDAALVSIPRDLYVQVPDNGSMKINSVYATYKQQAEYEGKNKKQAHEAGIGAIEKTVEDVIDLPINYYAMVDFDGFRKAINTVGGITITSDEDLYDYTVAWENNGSPLLAKKGENNFNGDQALLYARSRHGSARGDFDRAERQRQTIVALRDKVFTLGTFGNPVKVTQLLNAFGGHIRTNMSVNDLMTLYGVAGEIGGDKVNSVGLSDPPNDFLTTGNIGGLSVVMPKAGLYQYDDIQAYLRRTLKDGFIRKEDPKILVLNGTNTTGAASQYKDLLESYGYNVIGVGEAPTKNYADSVFVDLVGNDKPYTKRYLELRLGTTATGDLPSGIEPGMADFVIIVGQDETKAN